MNLAEAIEMLEAEYEKAKQLWYIENPVAWALFQVWKKAEKKEGAE